MVEAGEVEGKCKVIVRVRPLLQGEPEDAEAVAVDSEKNTIQVRLPSKGKKAGGTEKDGLPRATAKAKSYGFDCVLGPSNTNEDLFQACDIDGLVESSMRGYSQTVFAFGQTGSGKTYSICGSDEGGVSVSGLLERAASRCFDRAPSGLKVDLTCLEIYQEQVTDLLVEKKQVLPVRHHPTYGFYVQGLTQRRCEGVSDYTEFATRAFSRRRMASHSLNDRSTRSHLMITIHLTSEASGDNNQIATFGRLCFVDLAGSERLGDTRTKASSATIRAETGSINKSLFALGKVISMLGQRQGRGRAIIPFRDSKLTQLLMDSLQGKGRATMVACCSPLGDHADVTLSTLHYASLAQNVKSDPVVIHDPQDQLVIDLRKTIAELRDQNKKLAVQLRGLTTATPGEGEGEEPVEEEGSARARARAPEASAPAVAAPKKPERDPASKEKIRILKERSVVKRKAKGRRKSAGGLTAQAPRPASSISTKSPYGGVGAAPRAQSAKAARKPVTKAKKSKPSKSKPRSARPPGQTQDLASPGSSAAMAEDFPELAALEANFQAQLSAGQAASGAKVSGLDHSINAVSESSDQTTEFEGDEEAVRWAKRNPWFGNDYEMTEFAYAAHDRIVDRGVDPNSPQYFREIERAVGERFPDRMPPGTSRAARQTPQGTPKRRTVGSRLSQSIKAQTPSAGAASASARARRASRTVELRSENSREGRRHADFSSGSSSSQQYVSPGGASAATSKSERQFIVEELRRIKQEAEEERKWIMNQISSTLSSYKL